MDYKALYADLFDNLFSSMPELKAIVDGCIDDNHDAAEYIRGVIDRDIINETARLASEPEPEEINEDGDSEDDMYLARIGYSDKDEQKTTTIISVDTPARIHVRGWDSNVPLSRDDHQRYFSGRYQRSIMNDDEIVERAREDISEIIMRECRGRRYNINTITHLIESILLAFKDRGTIHRFWTHRDNLEGCIIIRIMRGSYACQFSFDEYMLTSY